MKRAAVLVLVLLAGCGGETAPGTDTETGLRFAVGGNLLTVAATRDMPAGVRTQLEGRRVLATCDVPGTELATLPKTWDDVDEPFTTTLQAKRPVDLAAEATRCRLELGGRVFASAKP